MVALLTALVLLQSPNHLTAEETKAGWKLLFDGKTTHGWRNFKAKDISEGWVVKGGVLTCADPSKAGDIVTQDKFSWFELVFDFNLTKGGNSGIMFHVVEEGDYPWQSGPEVQLYDHPFQEGVETTGFLYQLYPSKVDASKPAGQWNTMRILVTPERCETAVNGVKYYEYVLNSEDFKSRLAKSKFAEMPNFAKHQNGHLAIQGDHGVVSFRNIKIRPIHHW